MPGNSDLLRTAQPGAGREEVQTPSSFGPACPVPRRGLCGPRQGGTEPTLPSVGLRRMPCPSRPPSRHPRPCCRGSDSALGHLGRPGLCYGAVLRSVGCRQHSGCPPPQPADAGHSSLLAVTTPSRELLSYWFFLGTRCNEPRSQESGSQPASGEPGLWPLSGGEREPKLVSPTLPLQKPSS